jgi:hypothetical protein
VSAPVPEALAPSEAPTPGMGEAGRGREDEVKLVEPRLLPPSIRSAGLGRRGLVERKDGESLNPPLRAKASPYARLGCVMAYMAMPRLFHTDIDVLYAYLSLILSPLCALSGQAVLDWEALTRGFSQPRQPFAPPSQAVSPLCVGSTGC